MCDSVLNCVGMFLNLHHGLTLVLVRKLYTLTDRNPARCSTFLGFKINAVNLWRVCVTSKLTKMNFICPVALIFYLFICCKPAVLRSMCCLDGNTLPASFPNQKHRLSYPFVYTIRVYRQCVNYPHPVAWWWNSLYLITCENQAGD